MNTRYLFLKLCNFEIFDGFALGNNKDRYKFLQIHSKKHIMRIPTLQHSAIIKNLQVNLKVPFLIQLFWFI